jgi:hypothetical protein
MARDEELNPNYGYTTVSVRPKDVNDNAPEFVSSMQASVPESSPTG